MPWVKPAKAPQNPVGSSQGQALLHSLDPDTLLGQTKTLRPIGLQQVRLRVQTALPRGPCRFEKSVVGAAALQRQVREALLVALRPPHAKTVAHDGQAHHDRKQWLGDALGAADSGIQTAPQTPQQTSCINPLAGAFQSKPFQSLERRHIVGHRRISGLLRHTLGKPGHHTPRKGHLDTVEPLRLEPLQHVTKHGQAHRQHGVL